MKPTPNIDDFMPLPQEICFRKQIDFIRLLETKKDKNLTSKVESLIAERSSQASAALIYITIGMVAVSYKKFRFKKPHFAGISISLAFAYGVGQFFGTVHSADYVIKNIGALQYPDLEKSRIEIVTRCQLS